MKSRKHGVTSGLELMISRGIHLTVVGICKIKEGEYIHATGKITAN